MNFLIETINILEDNGKTPEDVLWVSNGKTYCTFKDFCKKADFTYDSGYGAAEINESLVIVGKDWWMERAEYDGSEWWEFKTIPLNQDIPFNPDINLKSYVWEDED